MKKTKLFCERVRPLIVVTTCIILLQGTKRTYAQEGLLADSFETQKAYYSSTIGERSLENVQKHAFSLDKSIAIASMWEVTRRKVLDSEVHSQNKDWLRFIGFTEAKLNLQIPDWWVAAVVQGKYVKNEVDQFHIDSIPRWSTFVVGANKNVSFPPSLMLSESKDILEITTKDETTKFPISLLPAGSNIRISNLIETHQKKYVGVSSGIHPSVEVFAHNDDSGFEKIADVTTGIRGDGLSTSGLASRNIVNLVARGDDSLVVFGAKHNMVYFSVIDLAGNENLSVRFTSAWSIPEFE